MITQVVMMIGIQGSGKSTKARELIENQNGIVFSSDEYRKKYNIQDNHEVFERLYNDLVNCIKNDEYKFIVFDATNTTMKSRRKFFEKVSKLNIIVTGYVMNTPLEECLKNNNNREDSVPDDVINRYYEFFQIPFYREGFSSIVFNVENLTAFSHYKRRKFLDSMDVSQDNPHHNETIKEHCETSANWFHRNCGYNEAFDEAFLFHDYGKVLTKSYDENNIAHYYNHASVGAYELMCNFDATRLKKIDDILLMLFLVNYHMFPFDWKKKKTINKYKRIFGELNVEKLLVFNKADKFRNDRKV